MDPTWVTGMKLLVVEDDERVSAALARALAKLGFDVATALTGAAAIQRLSIHPDLILLDIGLPDRDGMSVCREIRSISSAPIIMTTVRGSFTARVAGLNLGADDYLVKPYNLPELVARIRAVTRRYRPQGRAGASGDESSGVDAHRIVAGPLRIDLESWAVEMDGARVTLTRKEFDLLVALARHSGEVLRHDQLIDVAWPEHPPRVRRTLHVHMSSMRQKLGDSRMIESVHGVGYRLVPTRTGDP